MIKKSLVHLSVLGLLLSLSACGGAAEDPVSPPTSEVVVSPSGSNGMSGTTSSTPTPSDQTSSSLPASEPVASDDPVSADEIPEAIHGRFMFVEDGEEGAECTAATEDEGNLVEVDATSVRFFAWHAELKSVEESDATSILATFDHADDSDIPSTGQLRLELQDDGQTLLVSDLNSEDQSPGKYTRCSA